MNSLSNDKNELNIGIASQRHPIFDGEKPSEFKYWWDNFFTMLETITLEECVTKDYKDIKMTSNESTKLVDNKDNTNMKEITMEKKIKLNRKEMKKAKSFMFVVPKDCTKCLAMEACEPYEFYIVFKWKCSVTKVY